MSVQDDYRFRVWKTGKNWACHARSPIEWFRRYGFKTKLEATWWGEDAVKEMRRNDAVLERSGVVQP